MIRQSIARFNPARQFPRIAGAVAVSIMAISAAPAVALDVWVSASSSQGNAVLGQWNTSTGNLVFGSNVGIDGNTSGNSGPLGFDSVGAFAFAPDGNLWMVVESSQGNAVLGQWNTSTGNLVFGSNVGIDGNTSGNSGPFSFDSVGHIAFAPEAEPTPAVPEPATWALLIMGFGAVGVNLRRRPVISA